MIYRIVAQTRPVVGPGLPDPALPGPLAGVWVAGLPTQLWDGLPMPALENPRLRFWFTEAGWRRYGAPLAAWARDERIPVRVHRRKNPAPSAVAYRDEWQVALLPDRADWHH